MTTLKTRTPIPGIRPVAYSVGDETCALIDHWRAEFGSGSASAALREMVEHAWTLRGKREETKR